MPMQDLMPDAPVEKPARAESGQDSGAGDPDGLRFCAHRQNILNMIHNQLRNGSATFPRPCVTVMSQYVMLVEQSSQANLTWRMHGTSHASGDSAGLDDGKGTA